MKLKLAVLAMLSITAAGCANSPIPLPRPRPEATPPRPPVIPPAECQADEPEVPAFQPGPLPPPEDEVAHARAAADQAISYADEVRTEANDRRIVHNRCAGWSRRTAEEQLRASDGER